VRVFVAGASGAIGRPLVAALVAAKHEVIGMASRDEGVKVLRERGGQKMRATAESHGKRALSQSDFSPWRSQ
jgi:nucleoside-diphosphate-sugar epimerase